MKETVRSSTIVRFGVFDLDLDTGELRKGGLKARLQEQPFQVLALLVARPGELVTREELRERLWPGDTFVEFDQNLNSVIKKLREALGDGADSPRFIETLPRRGYRFIAPVEVSHDPSPRAAAQTGASGQEKQPRGRRRVVWAAPAIALLGVAGLAVWFAGQTARWGVARAEGPIESLAVLPLDNLSGDPEQEYFAAGMTGELIGELSKIRGLRVISRTSAMLYKNTEKPLPQVARELNVDAVVEGSILLAGERVRTTVSLVEASSDRHLWSESYQGDLSDVLAWQAEVAEAIAREVQVKVTPGAEARLTIPRKVEPQAYLAYLRALNIMIDQWRPDKGIEYFQQALDKDPLDPLAHTGLGGAYYNLAFSHAPRENMQKAKAAVARALEIDDTISDAHMLMGNILGRFERDWSGANREWARALELNPNNVLVYLNRASYLGVSGRAEEGIAEMKRAQQLDPLSPAGNGNLAIAYYFARRFDQAIELCSRLIENNTAWSSFSYATMGWSYLAKGNYEEGIAALQKATPADPKNPRRKAWLGYAKALAGERRQALEIADELNELSKRRYVAGYDLALVYTGLGDNDRALEQLQRGFDAADVYLGAAAVEPAFDPLRSDPRFIALLKKMNLAGSDTASLGENGFDR